jgi:hypothetical protein
VEYLSDEEALQQVQNLRQQTISDHSMSQSERDQLILISDMLIANYYGLSEVSRSVVEQSFATAKSAGWLSRAWRVFRSVVVTIVAVALVTAVIVASVVLTAGTATTALVASAPVWGAFAGALIGAAWGIHSASNDVCYYAGQCDVEYAGTQYCSTGQCIN